jgi:tetratricopeptide (TPR) repeat protein
LQVGFAKRLAKLGKLTLKRKFLELKMRYLKKIILTILFIVSLGGIEAMAQYDTEVFYWRGRQSLADGKYAKAIENFNILERLDTTNHLTYFYRGIAKYNLGDLRGAQTDFDTSIRINPVFTSGYHYRAITSSRFGKYDESLKDLERALELRPGFIGLYFSRGVTYFLSRQFENAIKDFDKYIRKEPKDPSAYLNRGASLLFLGDTTKALADYNKAIKLDRFDPEGYIRRGRLYADKKDYENAIADMDKAIELDTASTMAYFNRAIMLYEKQDYNAAMKDLNRVLRDEPGNALTLYNRGLINAQVGNYRGALEDMDRVLNINPNNVLAYFNRASIFIELERYQDALEDYDKAIELYPDFAKAYMNRSYVKNMMGDFKSSKKDYDTAQKKVAEYREKNKTDEGSFADTTKKYSSLLALDAEFAKKDFDDELLQHRDIDIRLKPLYKVVLSNDRNEVSYALVRKYENPLVDHLKSNSLVPVKIANSDDSLRLATLEQAESIIYNGEGNYFLKAILETHNKQFNSALNYYHKSVETEGKGVDELYKAFYLMNRGVLRADMIEFISSMESNVQVLTMDDAGTTRARVRDHVTRQYDYSEAIQDTKTALELVKDIPYLWFNLGNLYCLSSEYIPSIESYTKAIECYPYMGDAYFNRGLVLIYLKDKEKGCIDLSRSGELGVPEAYRVIKKFCEDNK